MIKLWKMKNRVCHEYMIKEEIYYLNTWKAAVTTGESKKEYLRKYS